MTCSTIGTITIFLTYIKNKTFGGSEQEPRNRLKRYLRAERARATQTGDWPRESGAGSEH